jgi:hypothetical protein
MTKKDLPLILAGVGVLYLITRPRTVSATGSTAVVVPAIPGVGSLVTGISGFLSHLLGGGYDTGTQVSTISNPGINPVTNPGVYPSGGGTSGPYDSGDPCDPSSVQYNPDVCTEMGG